MFAPLLTWRCTVQVCRCLRIRKIGKLYVLAEWRRKDKKKRMMLGPYWAFLLVTVSIIVGVTTVVFGLVVPSTFTLERIVGLALAVLALTSLLFTALSDPGIFPRYSRPLAESWTYSEYSQSYKPDGVVFCHQSQLLIEDYNRAFPFSVHNI